MSKARELKEFKKQLLDNLNDVKKQNFNTISNNPNSALFFYLSNLNDNLARQMSKTHYKQLSNGNGNELLWSYSKSNVLSPPKIQAVHSSSALFYNLLGFLCGNNIFIEYSGFRFNEVIFEKKFKLLKRKNYTTGLMYEGEEAIANPDGYLTSNNYDVIIESKFIESLQKNFNYEIHESYFDPEFYIVDNENQEYSKKWISLFKEITIKEGCKYISKFQNFDALQIVKHLIGIFNDCVTKRVSKSVELLNIIWDFSEKKQFPELVKIKILEITEAKELENIIYNFLKYNFTDMEFSLVFKVLTYQDFINKINLQITNIALLASTKENQIVLDPFMGSGTTCVVAKRLGRHWIGIERNKYYCTFAENRINQE